MPLTEVAIRNAKPGSSVRKLSDGGGLQLWIQPSGSKLWNIAYRFDGKQRKLSVGSHPAIGLADARKKRDEVKALLASGVDPSEQKRIDRIAKASGREITFAVIAAELLEKKRRENRAASTLTKTEWLLSFALPSLGKRPITQISASEILEVLKHLEKRDRYESARRLRSVIGEVFRYAIATARATSDPTRDLRGALTTPEVKHRAAILDPVAFGGLLRAIDGYDGQPTTKAALQLMAYLFPRPGELRLACWREFDFANQIWVTPAARAKMRREHEVPLPRQAIEILESLRPITGHGALVFPGFGLRHGAGRKLEPKPLSENALNGALRRMGYLQDQHSAHGFRSTASTLLNQSGKFSPDSIERSLAHQDANAIRRAYNRGAFWQERVEMAQWWADYIDGLREGGRVVALEPVASRRKR